MALAILLWAQSVWAQAAPRERISIDGDWRFNKDTGAVVGPGFVGGRGRGALGATNPAPASGRGRGDSPTVNAIAPNADPLSYARIKDWMMSNGEELIPDPANRHPRPAGNLGDDVPCVKTDFNDSAWLQVNLPHDWAIEGPFDPNGNGETGKLPFAGVAWYRKHLRIPASDAGKQIYLDVDGAMSYPNIWCNGQYAGGWGYGYSSFRVDLTPYLKPGADNVLSVRLDNPAAASRWYPGAGLYRNVWLVKTQPVHIGQWGTYITTPEVNDASATVNLKATLDNNSKADVSVTLKTEIFPIDMDDKRTGPAVATFDARTISIPAGKNQTAEAKATVASPKLWSPASPNRYVAVTTVEQNGSVVDSYETPFGIRSLVYDPVKGLLVNGRETRIQGVCGHSDLGSLGMAVNVRAIQRQLETLHDMGANAFRTTHNPPAPELLDLCDKMGFMVLDELTDIWTGGKSADDYHLLFPDWSEKDMRAFLRRDRNHPSVIMWSIGNEVPGADSPTGQVQAKRLAGFCHEEDPTRAVTSGRNSYNSGFNGYQNIMDAFGYNYLRDRSDNFKMYSEFHAANPNKMVFSSESASAGSTRGEYAFPPMDVFYKKDEGATADGLYMSSYDLYVPGGTTPPDWEWLAQDNSGIAHGEFVWTGFDYLGEPKRRLLQGPDAPAANIKARSSYFGIIDLAGFPKDRYYLYQSRWRPDMPMAHILPHWNWPERVGQVTPVFVYTTGDEGELFLNGKSLGRRKKNERGLVTLKASQGNTPGIYKIDTYKLIWDETVYEPGELKVVTYKDGKEWATATMKTTGPASKLSLKPDRATIAADGKDLCFVTVSIDDSTGAMVPRTHNPLKFDISGPGEIIAVDNGDPMSFVSFKSKEMNAFNGLCLVIVRAKPGQNGEITVHATSDGLATAEAAITAK
jgi:beta-galactosidase